MHDRMEKRLSCMLEKNLDETCILFRCAIHQNKLTFRSLYKKLEGATTRPQNISGPLGKNCKTNCHNQPTVQSKPVENPTKKILVSKEVLNDLSTDQNLLYEYTKRIGVGEVDQKYTSWKIGPIHHAQ